MRLTRDECEAWINLWRSHERRLLKRFVKGRKDGIGKRICNLRRAIARTKHLQARTAE